MKKLKLTLLIYALVSITLAACSETDPTPTPFAANTVVPDPTNTAVATAAESSPTPPESVPPTAVPEPIYQFPPAEILNDEGGVVNITGVITYTNPFFTLGVTAPVVILEDQAGFVDRNEAFLMPVASQTLGQITSDFFESPFSFNLSLPIEPQGTLNDVDNDVDADLGVQVFAIAYWNNTFGDPFLEERDLGGGGWSTAYASTLTSSDAELRREITGGKFLIYSPDDQQGFPAGFGEDGLLFTEDDPIVGVPLGYTIVDMDSDPFTFDRSRHQVVDLIEPEGAALVDYSDLSYTESFDSLVEQLAEEYAFTEYKGIDWDQLKETYRPRFETADARSSADMYRQALRDFAWQIPDGHISGPFLLDEFRNAAGGGIGIAVRELADQRVIVNFLLEAGPAAEAGMQLGAEIVEINDANVIDYVANTVSYFGPYSTEHAHRLHQLLFATRFPIGTEVVIAYLNPGQRTVQQAKLTATPEIESFNFWFKDSDRDGFELPVEYELLESGYGYVQIFSFSDSDTLTVQLWERMIRNMNENNVTAVIIDMRQNGGGRGFLADQMAAYFFDEPLTLGNSGSFDEDRGEFYIDPRYENKYYLPSEELRYHGDLVVLVGPDCASACEFFSYDLTLEGRATIIGHYPTAGLGGSIDRVAMPEDEEFTFTAGRAVDPNGDIHIEGIGVVPDIQVPVDEAAVLGDEDPILEAAIRLLMGDVEEAGLITLGEEKSGSLAANARVRYTLELKTGSVVTIVAEGSSDLVINFFDEAGEFLGSREGKRAALEDFEVPLDFVLIIEIAGLDDSAVENFALTVSGTGE